MRLHARPLIVLSLTLAGCGGVAFDGASGRSTGKNDTAGGTDSGTGAANDEVVIGDEVVTDDQGTDSDAADESATDPAEVAGAFLTCDVVASIEVGAAVDESAFGCTAYTKDGKTASESGFDVAWTIIDEVGADVTYSAIAAGKVPWEFAAIVLSKAIPRGRVQAIFSKAGAKVGQPLEKRLRDIFNLPYVVGMETVVRDASGDRTKMAQFDGIFSVTFDWKTGVFDPGTTSTQFTVFRLPLIITLSDGTTLNRGVVFDKIDVETSGLDLSDLDWSHVKNVDPAKVAFTFLLRKDNNNVTYTNDFLPTAKDVNGQLVISGDDNAPRGWVGAWVKFDLELDNQP